MVADVTDKVQGEDHLWELAHTDSLTGLANRVTLRDALADALAQGLTGALLMVDLDHFKAVNDSQGHSAGDELLKAVTHRLRNCVRQGDLVARLGGDEFAVLLTRAADPDEASTLARRLVDSLALPFQVQGRHVRVGASVGITVWHDMKAGVDELLVQADLALYAAKGAGRDAVVTLRVRLVPAPAHAPAWAEVDVDDAQRLGHTLAPVLRLNHSVLCWRRRRSKPLARRRQLSHLPHAL